MKCTPTYDQYVDTCVTASSLPYTGVDLWTIVVLALILLICGAFIKVRS